MYPLPNRQRAHMVMRSALLATSLACSVNEASASIVFVGSGSPNAANFYLSQAYGEIKDAAGNLLASAGRIENLSTPPSAANQGAVLGASGSSLSFSAAASLGGFGLARAQATVSVSNAGANFGYNAVASQGYRTQTQFSSAATPGRVVFNFGLTGSESTPYGLALGRLDFLARAFTPGAGSFFDVFGGDALHAVGAGRYSFTYTGSTAAPLDILFYAAAAVVIQDGAIVPGGANFSAFANFANTFDLDRIDLYDESDVAISDWTLVDLTTQQIVYNQDGRVATPPIPEPSTYAMMLVGLAGLMLLGRSGKAAVKAI